MYKFKHKNVKYLTVQTLNIHTDKITSNKTKIEHKRIINKIVADQAIKINDWCTGGREGGEREN